jgi:hypothetical protein
VKGFNIISSFSTPFDFLIPAMVLSVAVIQSVQLSEERGSRLLNNNQSSSIPRKSFSVAGTVFIHHHFSTQPFSPSSRNSLGNGQNNWPYALLVHTKTPACPL